MIRERKPCVVLTFSTTTAAMSMEKRCGEHKIPGRLIPVPREITAGLRPCLENAGRGL